MAVFIQGSNANDLWRQARSCLDAKGASSTDTKELLHVMFELEDPRQKWVSCRQPAMSIGFVLAELMWILKGDNRAEVIDFWNPSYSKYTADPGSNVYHGAYGYRLAKNYGFDQLERAYNALKNNPNNRQTVLLYWDPRIDLPKEDGSRSSHDIPCNICSMLKLRDGVLDWTQVMRSNDIFMGLPYNLIQFTSLHEIMAGWLNAKLGKYVHYSDSLHLYERNYETSFDPDDDSINLDSLSVSKDTYHLLVDSIYDRMNTIIHTKLTEEQLFNIAVLNSEHQSYNNIMLIIGAYAANKLKYQELATKLVEMCTNKIYTQIWQNYIKKG